MGKVTAQFSMSLDGFIAAADDDVWPVMGWYRAGDTEFSAPGLPMVFKVSRASAELLKEAWPRIGAVVSGRHDFNVSKAWGGRPPVGDRAFILTHAPPAEWIDTDAPFTFVTDGIESAVAQAQAVAGDRNVSVGSSTTVRQCLQAGLLDEIQIDLVPILLGAGVRLFEHLGPPPISLDIIDIIQGTGVTHLRYRIFR
jgi:dihydrofolate reductase